MLDAKFLHMTMYLVFYICVPVSEHMYFTACTELSPCVIGDLGVYIYT